MAAAWVMGPIARLDALDRLTMLIKLGTRDLGLVAIIGGMIPGQMKLVPFSTLVNLTELLILVLPAVRFRRRAWSGKASF